MSVSGGSPSDLLEQPRPESEAHELGERLSRIFLRGPFGARPVHGRFAKFHADPHWKDLILFHEYFHGDDGSGLGASHQTGWTGLIARILQLNAVLTPEAAPLERSQRVKP